MWLLYAVLASALWGLNYSLTEAIYQNNISLMTLLFLQSVFSALIYLSVIVVSSGAGDFYRILERPLYGLILSDVLAAALGSLFVSLAIFKKNATLTGLIEISYPLFTIFFTWILFKKLHVNAFTLVGGILILSGVSILSIF